MGQYNVPSVPIVEPPVTVTYPEPKKTCVDKPISLPRVSCEDIVENKCIQVPEVEADTVTVDKCTYALGEPACQKVELTLPKQVCVELVYGSPMKKSTTPQRNTKKYNFVLET